MTKDNFKSGAVSLLLCLILLVPFSNNLFCMEQKVRIIKKDAELKTLPQIESPTIIGLPLGAEFSIAQMISEEWIKISLPPNKDGIVQSGYVQVSFIQIIHIPEDPIESKDIKLIQEYEPIEKKINVRTDEKYFYWQREYSAAKSRKSVWEGIKIFGGLATLGGAAWILVKELSPAEEIQFGYGTLKVKYHAPAIAWITAGVGVVAFTAGIIGINSTFEYIKSLESEGVAKGYVKFNAGIFSKYNSPGIQLAIKF